METTTAFDLNQAIQRWRENLCQSPAFQRENLDELQAHLRDSMLDLRACGLSAEESFVIAIKRLGNSQMLEAEFGRANKNFVWLDRVLWMLVGIQLWGLTSGFITAVARSAFAYYWRNAGYNWGTNDMVFPVTLFTLVNVVAFVASIAMCLWLIVQKGSSLSTRFSPWLMQRSTWIGSCVLLCVIAFCVKVFSSVVPALLFWAYGKDVMENAMIYSNYSLIWVSPFQVVIMIIATLILARKRLSLVKA
jgi:hypothetical protein